MCGWRVGLFVTERRAFVDERLLFIGEGGSFTVVQCVSVSDDHPVIGHQRASVD